jgi:phosphoribosylanthranilate isomerase
MFLPHVKICGITRRQDALLCAEAGVGALGAVFYAKSPRCIEPAAARKLFEGLDPQIARVGIFVNASVDFMVRTARIAALDVVQMHGEETTEKIEAVRREGFHVVQALKRTGPELLAAARALPPGSGFSSNAAGAPCPAATASPGTGARPRRSLPSAPSPSPAA